MLIRRATAAAALALVLAALAVAVRSAGTGCDLDGNWGGVGYAGSLFQVVQPAHSSTFTVFYAEAPQGLPGSLDGAVVTIPGWVGVVATPRTTPPTPPTPPTRPPRRAAS